jgi:hypothetical protein
MDGTTSKLDFCSIIDNLEKMTDYQDCDTSSEYFYLYEENFSYIASLTGDLEIAMHSPPYKIQHIINKSGDNVREAWDTVIATMEDTPHGTLAEIDPDIDEAMFDPYQIEAVQKKYRKKLERLTKNGLLDLMLWVSSTLIKYLDIKAAFDTMFSVLEELEQNNSMLAKDGKFTLPEAADVL